MAKKMDVCEGWHTIAESKEDIPEGQLARPATNFKVEKRTRKKRKLSAHDAKHVQPEDARDDDAVIKDASSKKRRRGGASDLSYDAAAEYRCTTSSLMSAVELSEYTNVVDQVFVSERVGQHPTRQKGKRRFMSSTLDDRLVQMYAERRHRLEVSGADERFTLSPFPLDELGDVTPALIVSLFADGYSLNSKVSFANVLND